MIDTKAVRALADHVNAEDSRPFLWIPVAQKALRQCAAEIDAKDAIINNQREALERTWFVLKDFGAHPGRTDDLLHDCVRRALDALKEDAARLEFLMRHISGRDLRTFVGEMKWTGDLQEFRTAIDRARKGTT
jgi:hypothetical protein